MKKRPAQIKTKKEVRWLIPSVSAFVLVTMVTVSFALRRNSTQLDGAPSPIPTSAQNSNLITLTPPALKSSISVESALKSNLIRRSFLDSPVSLKTVSQLLWAAQGVTVEWGGRTAPSVKSVYPLSIYLIANKVEGLNSGQYVYVPGDRVAVHGIKPIKEGDLGEAIFIALNQNSFKNVPGILVITGNMAKMASAFGGISHDKEVYLEAGHVAQNLFLQSETLKIGIATNSTFDDSIIRNIITIPEDETIIYLIPFGLPKN